MFHSFGYPMFRWTFSLILITLIFPSCKQDQKAESPAIPEDQPLVVADSLPVFTIVSTNREYISEVLSADPRLVSVEEEVLRFYEKRNHQTAWFGKHGLSEQTGKIVNLLRSYFEAGVLDTTLIVEQALANYREASSPEYMTSAGDTAVMKSDVLFTAQFFLLADKAWKGIDKPLADKLEWYLPLKKSDFPSYLNKALTAETELPGTPVFPHYNRMLEKLRLYSRIMNAGGWQTIPAPGSPVGIGDTSAMIVALKKRLHLTGEYSGDTTIAIFDDSLAAAVAQSRMCLGLKDTALIDESYIRSLNIPVEKRIRQMLLNLERWKWIPDRSADEFIAVNIPEFKMHVFSGGEKIRSMRVVVGKEASQTVIFSGNLETIVFSPYWNIPRSILIQETLPAIRRNHHYLTHNNLEVVTGSGVVDPETINWSKYSGNKFPYSIRQRPGAGNALGRVKFLFPNHHAIYLHDTPAKHLFENMNRMYSHGCIRIEEPEWLAEYLLREQPEWTTDSIRHAMHSGRELPVKVINRTPVYITYFTSWVDDRGRLHFRRDIYGHDRKLEAELFRTVN